MCCVADRDQSSCRLGVAAAGTWSGAGVLGPEAFVAVPFLDLLADDYASPWDSPSCQNPVEVCGAITSRSLLRLEELAAQPHGRDLASNASDEGVGTTNSLSERQSQMAQLDSDKSGRVGA